MRAAEIRCALCGGRIHQRQPPGRLMHPPSWGGRSYVTKRAYGDWVHVGSGFRHRPIPSRRPEP